MYYTNISYDEALSCKYNNKVFVWTNEDSEWLPEHHQVYFEESLAQIVDKTSAFVGVKDLIYVYHLN